MNSEIDYRKSLSKIEQVQCDVTSWLTHTSDHTNPTENVFIILFYFYVTINSKMYTVNMLNQNYEFDGPKNQHYTI